MKSLGRAIIQYNYCSYEKRKYGHRDTHTGKMFYENEGRDPGDVSTAKKG